LGSKTKKRSRASKSRRNALPIDIVKRSLERADFKQALKDARVWHRQTPSADSRSFLEISHIGRAEQLLKNGQLDDARRIAQELLDLDVTEASVQEALPELLLSLGLFDRLPKEASSFSEAEQQRLRIRAADQAVVQPEHTPSSMAELRDEALKIRAALEAVERSDHSAAAKHLRDISRHSLFADWKFFVRGLAAFYQHDASGMEANWSRLDPSRAPAGIAQVLKAATQPSSLAVADEKLKSKVRRLESQVLSGTVLTHLTHLQQAVSEQDWPSAMKTFRAVQRSLREIDGNIYQRLVRCLTGKLVHEGDFDTLNKFARFVEPLPIDPHWNRAKAIACEQSEFFEEDPEVFWKKYLDDLEDISTLTPPQRKLAQGLVWFRLAEFPMKEVLGLRRCSCGKDHSAEIEANKEDAELAFEKAFELAPTYEPAYSTAAKCHLAANRPERAAEIYLRLLQHAPDSLDALEFLAQHHLSRGEGRKAFAYANRYRELKPLDQHSRKMLATCHAEAAREFALASNLDQAHRELASAEKLGVFQVNRFNLLAQKAVIETKAGKLDAARQHIADAQETLDEATALWLSLLIQSIRYELPWSEATIYEERWRKALKRRCNGSAAGRMCVLMQGYSVLHANELSRFTPDLLAYLRRCTRVKWQLEDLLHVCDFLGDLDEQSLLAKFADKGTRQHPQCATFHFLAGSAELARGPLKCNRRKTKKALQRSIDLALKSTDSRDEELLEMARSGLELLESIPPAGLVRRFGEMENSNAGDSRDEDDFTIDDMQRIIQEVCAEVGATPEEVLEMLERKMGEQF